jgi:hypothetical protein
MIEPDLDAVQAIEQASFQLPWNRDHFLHEIAAPHSCPFVAVIQNLLKKVIYCKEMSADRAVDAYVSIAPVYRQ